MVLIGTTHKREFKGDVCERYSNGKLLRWKKKSFSWIEEIEWWTEWTLEPLNSQKYSHGFYKRWQTFSPSRTHVNLPLNPKTYVFTAVLSDLLILYEMK